MCVLSKHPDDCIMLVIDIPAESKSPMYLYVRFFLSSCRLYIYGRCKMEVLFFCNPIVNELLGRQKEVRRKPEIRVRDPYKVLSSSS